MNPHWDGASLTEQAWYAVGFLYGLLIAAGFLVLVAYGEVHRWWYRPRLRTMIRRHA